MRVRHSDGWEVDQLTQPRRHPGRPRKTELGVPTDVAIAWAAARLFMVKGYHAVTMEMVAEASGVTKAAVYYHFADKGSLFVAATASALQRAHEATVAVLGRNETLRSRLEDIAAVVLSLPQPFIQFEALMREAEGELSPDQVERVLEDERRLEDAIGLAIRDAAERGEIRAPDPHLAVHAYLGLLRVGQSRDGRGRLRFPDARRAAHLLVGIFWEGVQPTPEG